AARDQTLLLVVHLRMTGKFLYLTPDDELSKHAHAVFYLDGDRRLVFNDQRQFGLMKLVTQAELLGTTGLRGFAPEPFSDDCSREALRAVLRRSRRTLKTVLLDQTRILGLGNIYAAEALFRAGINPFKESAQLSSKRVARLHAAIVDVLQTAVSDSSTS